MIDRPASREPNVLLIIVDALRVDRVGVMGDDGTPSLTPTIDSIAADGAVFESSFACVNATDSAMTTIMTGLYPTRHGILNHGKNITDQERKHVSATTPLPDRLSETHRSIGVDMLGRWHKRGFDQYFMDRSEEWVDDPDEAPGLSARVARAAHESFPSKPLLSMFRNVLDRTPEPLPTVAESLYDDHLSTSNPYSTINRFLTGNKRYLEADWVANRIVDVARHEEQPWFVLGHFWDTHLPYNATDVHLNAVRKRNYPNGDTPIAELVEPIAGSSWARTIRRLTKENDWETQGDIERAYDASIRLVDDAIGDVVRELKTVGAYDDTAIIITADHGESLTEHGILFDHHGLYDSTIHVPMIVKAPGFEGVLSGFVQHTDIVPTILDICGYPVESDDFDGYSLAISQDDWPLRTSVISEEGNAARKRAIRTDSYKYIRRLDHREVCRYCGIQHAGGRELYDLRNDAQETDNLSVDRPLVREQLEEEMDQAISPIPRPQEDRVTFAENEDVLKQLEYMGYK